MTPGFPPHKLTAHFKFAKRELHDGKKSVAKNFLTRNLRSSIAVALHCIDRSRWASCSGGGCEPIAVLVRSSRDDKDTIKICILYAFW